jgi:hypothetical protein
VNGRRGTCAAQDLPGNSPARSVPSATFDAGLAGYAVAMTEENGRQEGVGKTAGLPGHHADTRTRELPADQLDDTVAMGDSVAPPATAGEQGREEDDGG